MMLRQDYPKAGIAVPEVMLPQEHLVREIAAGRRLPHHPFVEVGRQRAIGRVGLHIDALHPPAIDKVVDVSAAPGGREHIVDAGLGEVNYPTQTAAWADYDNDGDLDLVIGNEGFPVQLFRNDGRGHFRDVARAAGIAEPTTDDEIIKGVAWGDIDNDNDVDLFLSVRGNDNHLFRNNGDGTFSDIAAEAGVTRPSMSFPVWFWDFNNDGALDLFVSSYREGVEHVAADYFGRSGDSEPDCLYRGDGAGGFREVAAAQGLVRVTQPMGCNHADIDNDGWPDFYLGTGYPEYAGVMPNLLFRNRGGTGFADVTIAAGFGHLQKGHAVAFADFDHLPIEGWWFTDRQIK